MMPTGRLSSLQEVEGLVDQALDELRAKGLVFDADGATWLRSTELGLDRDLVVVFGEVVPDAPF